MSTDTLNETVLDSKLAALEAARSWSPRLVSKLETAIRSSSDTELYRINPYLFARDKGIGESEAVDLFLYAVHHGLFEMDWNLVCPGCGGVIHSSHHLDKVEARFHCDQCALENHTSMDDELHVSFSLSPKVREIAPPDAVTVMVKGDPYLSGKRLITTQTFRDLFRSEIVSTEEGIEIRDITIIFTDLKGSTQLYDEIGDPKAYYLVRQHFETLGGVVSQFEGATIKTIGDAVMATFLTPLDGLKASVQMLKGIEKFNENISEKLVLKIGIHRGRSIAVTLNDRLDYFGQTVNIAARVQTLAGPGEIYLTQAVYDYPGIKEYLVEAGGNATPETAVLKGVSDKVTVYKVLIT